jgi:hypothetical protein
MSAAAMFSSKRFSFVVPVHCRSVVRAQARP